MNIKKLCNKFNLTEYIAFDLETTGLNPSDSFIIEFGGVRFVNGQPQDRLSILIQPPIPIPQNITELTGIDNQAVADAPALEDVAQEIINFLGDLPLVAHNINFDAPFLQYHIQEVFSNYNLSNPLYDSLLLAKMVRYDHSAFNLSAVAQLTGVNLSHAHRAEDDALACGEIFLNLLPEVERATDAALLDILPLVRNMDLPNGKLFQDLSNFRKSEGIKVENQTASLSRYISLQKSEQKQIYPDVEDVFGQNGLMEKRVDGFEVRATQVEMANAIYQTMLADGTLIAEAGTGTGKSLAYLVPSVLWQKEFGEDEKIVISSHTKTLQDQLFFDQIPLVKEKLGIDFNAVMLKGRKNFLCKTRWQNTIKQAAIRFRKQDRENLMILSIWRHETNTGDISEHNGFNSNYHFWLWSQIASEPGYCTSRRCEKHNGCFLGALRKAAQKADILVVNHSLLLSDLASGGEILFPMSRLIVDEAHVLEKDAYSHFKISWNHHVFRAICEKYFIEYSGRISGSLSSIGLLSDQKNDSKLGDIVGSLLSTLKLALENSESFFTAMYQSFEEIHKKSQYVQKKRFFDTEFFAPFADDVQPFVDNVKEALDHARAIVKILEKKEYAESKSLLSDISNANESMSEFVRSVLFLTNVSDANFVYWYEFPTRGNVLNFSLNSVPIDVGEILGKSLFNKMDSLVLCSATMKTANSFHYIKNRMGIRHIENHEIDEVDFGSPFDFQSQCMVLVPKFFPAFNQKGWHETTAKLIAEISQKTKRNILALFTSHSSLQGVKSVLSPLMADLERKLLTQGFGTNRWSLLESFKNAKGSVLLATDSFWQGVDFPGDALEILIMAKLPFGVPTDPIAKSISDQIQQGGGNSFNEYSVPEAIVKFRQGFGRLIRTMSDRGVMVVLDERMIKKYYGRAFQESLPVKTTVETAESLPAVLAKFFDQGMLF